MKEEIKANIIYRFYDHQSFIYFVEEHWGKTITYKIDLFVVYSFEEVVFKEGKRTQGLYQRVRLLYKDRKST